MQIYMSHDREIRLREYSKKVGKHISNIIGEFIDGLEEIKSASEKYKIIEKTAKDLGEIDLGEDVGIGFAKVNACEAFACKRTDTTFVKREGYDDDGNLRTYEKWLCPVHKK